MKLDADKTGRIIEKLGSASLVLVIANVFLSALIGNVPVVAGMLGLALLLGIAALVVRFRCANNALRVGPATAGVVLSTLLLVAVTISYYHNALTNAIEDGNVERIRRLVADGYDVNADSGGGQNMLTLCFSYGLQKISVFGDARKIERMTPEEVENKIYAMLEVLIDSGANINTLDPHGWAPIHCATGRNQRRIIRMLIEKGANVNLEDGFGNKPLNKIARHPGSSELITLLIKNGAQVNAKGWGGNTPLHDSVISEDVMVAETLLAAGADVSIQNSDGKTALQLSIEEGEPEIAELLRKYGASE
jgi:ankyrin repeat protein